MPAEVQDAVVIPGAELDPLGAGLGYCLACLTEYKMAPANRKPPWPRAAITMAPAAVPAGPMGVMAIVAVPTCYPHLDVPDPQPGPGLIRAQGSLPGHK